MRRDELTELHYITPSANLPTILRYGIHSHRRAEVGRSKGILQPVSIAMQDVRDIRGGASRSVASRPWLCCGISRIPA